MANKFFISTQIIVILFFAFNCYAQLEIEEGDPANNTDLPSFYKSKLTDIDTELKNVSSGKVEQIAVSPGGLPIFAVYYGSKDDFRSQANYNSAVAAQNPAYYAQKNKATKPVIYFIGPVHGQEAENIVGMVNLIHIAETGKDHRGNDYSLLKQKLDQCRVIIIPCGNPDGRKRCPYDSFVGLPSQIMTKYGQGTRKDGTLYAWPGAKAVHPMKGDVKILGAYFNDNGINIMQDEYFDPMAEETKAILKIAKDEAPDMTVSVHSHENPPVILQPAHVPMFMKTRVYELATNLNNRYKNSGIPNFPDDWFWKPSVDDEKFPPRKTFNLISALHHISGTMSFTFECPHGVILEDGKAPIVDYNKILDAQLTLYDEMLDYLLENRLYWENKN